MRVLVLAAVCVVLAGCAPRSGGAPSRGPAPPARAGVAADSLAAPWEFRDLGRPRTQQITTAAVVYATVDSVTRVDSVATDVRLEWSVLPDREPLRVAGLVRAFGIRGAGDSAWRALPAPTLPTSFVAAITASGGAPVLVNPDAASCLATAAVAGGWRETWVGAPSALRPGMTWSDSTDYPLCRDGVVLEVTSVRRFTATEAVVHQGRVAVSVTRESRVRMSGHGVQFGDSVRVRAEGEGTATLLLSRDGGVIVAGNGESELRLTLEGRRRTQQLVQHSALSISAP
ncbi:MAG: hypothetical protein KF689_13625 [Gemmatimonadaceae bacterium]|nr:hypothetical protein [Gemmatimonadaceae bacterium]MCW5826975.1 hypothetical protein [Gemmatimonadaceae bacterium]